MLKIGILGSGTAGVTSAMTWINECQQRNVPVQVVCIHNPSIPGITVGETTSSPLVNLMCEVIDFKPLRDLPEFNGTLKYGTWYNGFGKERFNTWHAQPAIHIDASKYPNFVIKQLKVFHPETFVEIQDTILSYADKGNLVEVICSNGTYYFDYVIDCSGFPTDDDLKTNCSIPEFETVNSAIIFPEFVEHHEMYTSSTAHEHGWMFGIPLTHRKAHGFLYNKDITSFDEAKESFKKLKNLSNEQLESTRKISWKWFHRNSLISNRIMYSGNKLYFYEPAQALSLLYYFYNVREHAICVLNGQYNRQVETMMNQRHLDYISGFMDLHSFYYQGSKHLDSPFWKEIREKTSNRLANSLNFKKWLLDWNDGNKTGYSFHTPDLMEVWVNHFIDFPEFYNKFN
jgi:hypothetical protein